MDCNELWAWVDAHRYAAGVDDLAGALTRACVDDTAISMLHTIDALTASEIAAVALGGLTVSGTAQTAINSDVDDLVAVVSTPSISPVRDVEGVGLTAGWILGCFAVFWVGILVIRRVLRP